MRVAPAVLFLTLLTLFPTGVLAETRYVIDELIVTVRTGPSTRHQILQSLKSGTGVEVLEESGDYLKVRTPKGIEGYTLKQYYSTELPKALQIARLEKTRTQLTRKIAQLEEQQAKSGQVRADQTAQLQAKDDRIAQLQQELATATAETKAVGQRYEQLQRDAGQVTQIIEERNRLKQQTELLTERLSSLQEENAKLLRSGMIHWFLAGAGVFFIGWLSGKVSRKRRSTF